MGRTTEFAIGILNGAVGDYLHRTRNGLATEMVCVADGQPEPLLRAALARRHPQPTSRIVVLVHGLMCTEDAWRFPDGGDYGSLLARDLGYTPLTLRYNSGRAIPDNGAALAQLLERLVTEHPVPIKEILLIGFSMGGLVIRSACHSAASIGHAWLSRVARAIYIGTPHRGAPLERAARLATRLLSGVDDPYTQLAARLINLRSDGLQDLGDADLRHQDRSQRRASLTLRDPEHPVPLLPAIQHYLVAGTVADHPALAVLFGDAIVPVSSATNGECIDAHSIALPPSHVKIFPATGHMALARDPSVYEQIHAWCEEAR